MLLYLLFGEEAMREDFIGSEFLINIKPLNSYINPNADIKPF